MTYPATTYAEGVELTITSGNQLHEIINGDATEEINTESGMVPSVRKALADSMLFKPAIAWAEGSVESDPFQTRLYGEGIYWAPAASNETPISMGTNPNIDGNWFLAPVTGGETISRNTNLLSNHNFIIKSPDDITHPSVTPTDYVVGTQIFSGVFVGDDIVGLTYIDGRVSWASGTLYFSVPNSGALEYVDQTDFVASVADFDGKPRVRGVSFALVGDEYLVTVGVDALEDESSNETLLGSVKLEQGSVATGHKIESYKGQTHTFNSVAEMVANGAPVGSKVSWFGYYEPLDGGGNCGVVKQGVHTPDGGRIFSVGSNTYVEAEISGYVDPLKFGASITDKTKNAPAIQAILDDTGKVISHNRFEIDSEVNVPDGARFNFLNVGGIYSSDGYLTSDTGKSLLVLEPAAEDILFEGVEFNGGSGILDFTKWPNTDTTGNEASVGLTRPVKLISHQANKNVRYRGCKFLNSVGGAIKEFGTFAGSNPGEIDLDDCYWDLIRGNCIDGEFSDINVTRQVVNLIGDIRQATRGGLVVVTADNALVTDIKVRQTTDSTIYLNGTGRGRHVVNSVNVRYSGKDAIKVLNATDNSLFGDINVLAAGKTPVGFFGGSVANGVLGTIKIGFSKGSAPTDILDQTDVTWSTPKTITACNIQEAKWDQGGGNGGTGFAIVDSNVAFSTLSVSSYTGLALSLSATKISGGNVSVNYGDGAAIYETATDLSLDNLQISEANQDLSKSPFGGVHAIQALGSSNMSVTSLVFKELGGGLLITGPDTFRMNIDDLSGDGFNTEANSDAHLIYANSASSPDTVTELNISNVSVKGTTTAGRILWARNVKGLNISNWHSDGGIDGIRLTSCSRVNMSNVIARSAANDGVRASTCTHISLSNVQGHDNGGVGVKTDGDCVNVIALGCQGSGNATNLDVQGTNVKPVIITDFNIG